ncbi:hypothetical protein ACJ41O_011944 [Fusarium nematophilum]
MQGFLLLGAAALASANAMNFPRGGYYYNTTSATSYTTSTIYTTKVHTVTKCPPEVVYCPGEPYVTTETIAISTTVCPVTEKPHPTPDYTKWTTSTVYSTRVYTVTKCPPEVPYCPGEPHVTTETVAVSTTVCPVTDEPHYPPKPPKPTYVPPPPHHGGNLTSTLYTTKHYTITKCPPEVPDCPIGQTTTTVYATGTTCIPVWNPTTKVEHPPVYTKPVYTKPVHEEPEEPEKPHPTKPVHEEPEKPEQPEPPVYTKPVPEPEKPVPTKPAETYPAPPPATTAVVPPVTPVPTEPAQVTAAAGRVMGSLDVVAAMAGVAALFL